MKQGFLNKKLQDSFEKIQKREVTKMKKHLVRFFLFLAVGLVISSTAYAEHLFGPDELDTSYGAVFRVRQEVWDNVVTLDTLAPTTSGADRNFLRLKTSLFGKLDYDKKAALFLKVTNEMKWYGLGPYDSFKNNPNNDKFDPDEIIVDNLFFDAKNLLGAVDIRIGRQDFIGTYGEGFLLMDGTPGDGSRSFYFNAAKANVKVSQNFNFDLTYITDPKTDIYLPSIHPSVTGTTFQFVNNKKVLTASNEQAVVVYGRGKIDKLTVEPYYVYKTEKGLSTGGIDPTRLDLNTFGARILYSIDKWNMGGELAYQFGEYDDGRDRTGTGGYVFVGRKYDTVMWKPEFELRYVYLSGDKSGTDKVETWDPLFSRNPYWNELIIYTLIPETSKYGGSIPGYWTNMEIFKVSGKANFSPETSLALSYQYLWAPQSTAGLPSAMFSNSGHSRGHLPTAVLSHKFSKNVDGYLQFEYFAPENFYSSQADDAIFFRWQLQVKL